jgi:hypothetical protein
MKVNVPNNNASKTTRRVAPPVPYERPEKKNYAKGEYITLKLRTVPADENSATHDLIVPYFSMGTPEEWLRWKRDLGRVLQGQNVTTGPGKYNMTRRLLEGDALAAFNAAAAMHGNETNDNFLACMRDVTTHIFPARALQMQKRFMRRFLRKPAGTKTREFVARVNEINEFIREFPTVNGEAATPLPEDEILDLLEFGVPNSWQKQFLMHQFDPQAHTVMEFVEFCERIEATEDPTDGRKNDKAHDVSKNKKSEDKQKSKRKFNDDNKGNGKYCLVHGPGHDSHECKLLGAEAKRLKRAFEEKNNNKPHENANNKKTIWRKRIEEGNFSQDEINAIAERVAEIKKNEKTKKRSAEEVDDLTNFNYEDLEALDISDSEESNDD